MCGKATFATVVSTNCIRLPIVAPAVTMMRWKRSTRMNSGAAGAGAATVAMTQKSLPACASRTVSLGIHRDMRRKARDHRAIGLVVDRNPHRHALRHLDPVTGGILRRQHRKFRSGPGADARHMAAQLHPRIGVELQCYALADPHAVE